MKMVKKQSRPESIEDSGLINLFSNEVTQECAEIYHRTPIFRGEYR